MKIHLINIGCKVNFAETSRLKDLFEKRGHEITDKATDAQVILINTCTVTNRADSDCRKSIRKAKREAPNAYIGVFGCFAQLNPDELEQLDEVNAVYGIKEKFMIPDLIEAAFNESANPFEHKSIIVSDLSELHFDAACSCDNESRSRAFLKIQDGCDYSCTYCTIPAARGANRCLDFADLPSQFQIIQDGGYKEAVISGINIGEYHSKEDKKFIDVVNLIAASDIGFRVRISSIEPNLVTEEMINVIAGSANLCNHLHIPLQSGSDTILKLMKRRYNTTMFREKIELIKSIIPDCCIGLDVITGFPGETDDLFEQTYSFLKSLPISYLHVFTYSERAGTPAVDFKGVVSHIKRKDRTIALRKLSDRKLKEYNKSQVGKTVDFLPERFFKDKKYTVGHTENYLNCKVVSETELENKLYKVEIVSAEGEFVVGKIV